MTTAALPFSSFMLPSDTNASSPSIATTTAMYSGSSSSNSSCQFNIISNGGGTPIYVGAIASLDTPTALSLAAGGGGTGNGDVDGNVVNGGCVSTTATSSPSESISSSSNITKNKNQSSSSSSSSNSSNSRQEASMMVSSPGTMMAHTFGRTPVSFLHLMSSSQAAQQLLEAQQRLAVAKEMQRRSHLATLQQGGEGGGGGGGGDQDQQEEIRGDGTHGSQAGAQVMVCGQSPHLPDLLASKSVSATQQQQYQKQQQWHNHDHRQMAPNLHNRYSPPSHPDHQQGAHINVDGITTVSTTMATDAQETSATAAFATTGVEAGMGAQQQQVQQQVKQQQQQQKQHSTPLIVVPSFAPGALDGSLPKVASNNKMAIDAVWPSELLEMPVPQLNRYIRSRRMRGEDVRRLKEARRRMKNRLYAKKSRSKRLARLKLDQQEKAVAILAATREDDTAAAVEALGVLSSGGASAFQQQQQQSQLQSQTQQGHLPNEEQMNETHESQLHKRVAQLTAALTAAGMPLPPASG